MLDPSSQTDANQRIILITGPSGAGRSTAINTFEDMGFETIDNLPLTLLPRLLDGPPAKRPMALGIDVRNRDFSTNALVDMIGELSESQGVSLEVLFLDCRLDVLMRRYSETRRRHPLAPEETPKTGIEREFDLLVPIRARSNVLIDTSEMTPHDLRAEIGRQFGGTTGQRLAVTVQSFSYKRGIPRGVDMIFDVRFLRNPYWKAELRRLNGQDKAVADYVSTDKRFPAFFEKVSDLSKMLLPAYMDEGKAHFSIGFGCTGGQHRSVTLAIALARDLAQAGWLVSVRHRELERGGLVQPQQAE
ncbi:RNase adapter RapZ [Cochlodiniinecator piscidefendens]|uniref:RNase adapter RapZ n=1 Tax=Cochlodiniinecator piscidefendens TaxID=2715756 RepID=UPI00140E02AE|nr:RNase adapter RapZ [Cochlodiniinecator piscidefendens]